MNTLKNAPQELNFSYWHLKLSGKRITNKMVKRLVIEDADIY